MQLAHAGRKASTGRPWESARSIEPAEGGWQPVAPSAVPFRETSLVPQALTIAEIETELIPSFVAAAHRAVEAGFGVIELHAAHGYLFHQFLSPHANHRTDAYGTTFDGRTRLLMQTVDAVRAAIPNEFPLWVRISTTDWTEPEGWTLDDSVNLARGLQSRGVDLVDCSSGGAVPNAVIPVGAGYQTEAAARIRREAGLATGAVGMITEPMQAETILRTGQADVVLLARELLRDPYWPLHAAKTVHADREAPLPNQYERAFSGWRRRH